jgi:hypothetical protein
MTPAVPQPLQRVHTRLLQRDSIRMLSDRIQPQALLSIANWLARSARRGVGLEYLAPVMADLIHRVHMVACEQTVGFPPTGRRHPIAREALFGVGLVVGCQLRDEAEADSPMPCTIRWTSALAAMESTTIRQALWSIGLPDDLLAVATLALDARRRSPGLTLRPHVASGHAGEVWREAERRFPEAPFLLGLAGAGITLPGGRLPALLDDLPI